MHQTPSIERFATHFALHGIDGIEVHADSLRTACDDLWRVVRPQAVAGADGLDLLDERSPTGAGSADVEWDEIFFPDRW